MRPAHTSHAKKHVDMGVELWYDVGWSGLYDMEHRLGGRQWALEYIMLMD